MFSTVHFVRLYPERGQILPVVVELPQSAHDLRWDEGSNHPTPVPLATQPALPERALTQRELLPCTPCPAQRLGALLPPTQRAAVLLTPPPGHAPAAASAPRQRGTALGEQAWDFPERALGSSCPQGKQRSSPAPSARKRRLQQALWQPCLLQTLFLTPISNLLCHPW